MRILVDLQGAQGGSSRFRGIGRYGLSLTKGLARWRGEHEVFVALNAAFSESNEAIRAVLQELVPKENIITWGAPTPNFGADPLNDPRRNAAEKIRESVLASLKPDYILVTSMFEGWGDNVVTSIGALATSVPTAVVLYDLIPLIYQDVYLRDDRLRKWYYNKIDHLRRADLILTISESSRQEALDYLGADENKTFNISSASEEHFTAVSPEKVDLDHIGRRYGIFKPFIMYTGGIDFRKNIERLIEAFSLLPRNMRRHHQLAIVCSVEQSERARLLHLAEKFGVEAGDIVLTGFIPEDDLLRFYRACKLFIFPSWHEGFGLPVLEAMKCGKAVIASDRSSLPEVIQRDDSLFDPFNVREMSRKIEEVLRNDSLRMEMERHSVVRASHFSWETTCRRAWRALEAMHADAHKKTVALLELPRRPRLAFISPLPPELSGIADYSAELIPELSRHYRIDIIAAQNNIDLKKLVGDYPVRDVQWFKNNSHKFDRILYHLGNSSYHEHMFDLLKHHPGVVVLHDFYLSGIANWRDVTGTNPHGFARELINAHGWPAVIKRFNSADVADVIWEYPCNIDVLQDAMGIIVHSNYSRLLAKQWYGHATADNWKKIPLLRQPLVAVDSSKCRAELGFGESDFIVCSFGMVAKTKMNVRLLKAWLASPLSKNPRCHLVFVGQNDGGGYGDSLREAIDKADAKGRIIVTGWTDMAIFRQWLAVADVGVQLRTLSRGETSAAVLDCMNAGLATIVNANGSMAELPENCVSMLPDEFSDEELSSALTALWSNPALRRELGVSAKAFIASEHQPRRCADEYFSAIEKFYRDSAVEKPGLINALVESGDQLSESDWTSIIRCVSENRSAYPRLKRLFVDVSELVRMDSRSGIQRVVKSVLSKWLVAAPHGWIVEPVYAEHNKAGFRHARTFTSRFLGIPSEWCEDDIVEPFQGDIFLGLDLSPTCVPQQMSILQNWKRRGVIIKFVVYDLLPILHPEYFMANANEIYHQWMKAVTKFDGLLCISRSVADEAYDWLQHYGERREVALEIDWFHLGADSENSTRSVGIPDSAKHTLSALKERPSFLVVGTIEPRKGLRQVLDAFEKLWDGGAAINLVLVGKLGWMMDEFATKLRSHRELNRRLFWLEAISDEYLELIYQSSRCLIAASKGEGFGLPLVEAANHRLPVIARDIPVFREVANSSAYFFEDTDDANSVVEAIRYFISSKRKKYRKKIPYSWSETSNDLLIKTQSAGPAYRSWMPDNVHRFWGSDIRLLRSVGLNEGKIRKTEGKSGFLVYGPYYPINEGNYNINIAFKAYELVGTEYIEIMSDGGTKCHWRRELKKGEVTYLVDDVVTFEANIADFEIRIWVDDETNLSLEWIVIRPGNPN